VHSCEESWAFTRSNLDRRCVERGWDAPGLRISLWAVVGASTMDVGRSPPRKRGRAWGGDERHRRKGLTRGRGLGASREGSRGRVVPLCSEWWTSRVRTRACPRREEASLCELGGGSSFGGRVRSPLRGGRRAGTELREVTHTEREEKVVHDCARKHKHPSSALTVTLYALYNSRRPTCGFSPRPSAPVHSILIRAVLEVKSSQTTMHQVTPSMHAKLREATAATNARRTRR
jgi:hypothetical protein